MGGSKKSKKDHDRKSRKKEKHTPVVSREPSDDESYYDDASNEANSLVPSAAKVDMEAKSGEKEDDFGAKDFRSEMEMRADHERTAHGFHEPP